MYILSLQHYILFNSFQVPLPCLVSNWSKWIGPDATGSVYRVRMVVRPSINGGEKCPDLIQLKKGIVKIYVMYDLKIEVLNDGT